MLYYVLMALHHWMQDHLQVKCLYICAEGICQLIVWLQDNRALWHRGICCSTSGLVIQTVFICRINQSFRGISCLMKNTEYCQSPLILCAISVRCLRSFHFTNQRRALHGQSLPQTHKAGETFITHSHQYQNLRQAEQKALMKGYWNILLNSAMAEYSWK